MIQTSTLKSISEFIRTGKTPPTQETKYFNGEIQWFTPGDLDKEKYLGKSMRSLTEASFLDKKATYFPAGTLLVACIGDIGKLGITTQDCSSNQQITGIKPNISTDVNYLYYWFRHSKMLIQHFANNAVVPIINNGTLEKIKIPLPPLAEQKKIASILDAADSLRQKDQQLIEKYTALSQSLFLEMFGDPVTNPMGWDFSKIVDLTEGKTLNGFFAKKEHYVEEGVPIVWITDFINKIYVNTEGLRKVNIKEDDISKYKLAYGDVLFCRSSLTVEGIGKCAIVPKSIAQDVLFECHIIKVRLGNKVIPEYFRFLSNTSYFRSKIMKNAKTSTMTTISQEGITNIFIPVPPISLQNQFAERIQFIEAQKQQALISLQKSEALFNSLLQRAFKGELTV